MARSEVGNGVAAALRAVDCVTGDMTQAAFGRMFSPGGALGTALTIMLTLYVAFFAISLLTGRSRIGISALTPRMMTLGLVLTFATSWVAYQSVVWNLATGAPDEIVGVITGSQGSATTLFADKVDIVFAAITEATKGSAQANAGTFSPPNLVWLGAMLFMLGTVGVLVTTRIALAVLIAIGPVFVVLALFPGTRGLFVGWLKGVVMLALTPLFAVLGGSLILELAVPVIGNLVDPAGGIDAQSAMGFFLIGAVHVALMMLATRTATTMVGGWRVFGLAGAGAGDARGAAQQAAPMMQPATPTIAPSAAAPAGSSSGRAIALSAIATGPAANDGSRASATRAILFDSRVGSDRPASAASQSRVRGIGSRYRTAPTRLSEKPR